MPKKLDSCVKKVMKKGYDKNSAYAICSKSTGYIRTKNGRWKKVKRTREDLIEHFISGIIDQM